MRRWRAVICLRAVRNIVGGARGEAVHLRVFIIKDILVAVVAAAAVPSRFFASSSLLLLSHTSAAISPSSSHTVSSFRCRLPFVYSRSVPWPALIARCRCRLRSLARSSPTEPFVKFYEEKGPEFEFRPLQGRRLGFEPLRAAP